MTARKPMARQRRTPLHLDGRIHPDYTDVEETLREQLQRYPGGAAVCVYHHGECVVDLWGGYRDDQGSLWRSDTMSPSFSTTKGVACKITVAADNGISEIAR